MIFHKRQHGLFGHRANGIGGDEILDVVHIGGLRIFGTELAHSSRCGRAPILARCRLMTSS